MTFGTFDHLHAGHEHYLREASKHGHEMITVLARDETVKKVKGELPDHNEIERKQKIEESNIDTKVVLGNIGDKYEVIRKFKPDVICLGYDQYTFTQKLQKELIDQKLNTEIIRIKPYKPEVFKSSLIKKATA
jgi:FAD synthetase